MKPYYFDFRMIKMTKLTCNMPIGSRLGALGIIQRENGVTAGISVIDSLNFRFKSQLNQKVMSSLDWSHRSLKGMSLYTPLVMFTNNLQSSIKFNVKTIPKDVRFPRTYQKLQFSKSMPFLVYFSYNGSMLIWQSLSKYSPILAPHYH